MRITRIHASEMDGHLVDAWRGIQQGNAELKNPYFCIEYLLAVSSVKDNVFVGLMEDGARAAGFVAWEEKSRGVVGPVGARLSDYQGLIIDRQQPWDAEALMKACGVKIWDFDHFLMGQLPPAGPAVIETCSPVIDLSRGFQEYLREMKQRGAKRLFQLQRKERKFERERGKLDFQLYADDDATFEAVIAWKNRQCRATGVPEFMGWRWVRDLLERIRSIRTDDFSGILSVLSCDGDIVAAHFGLRSREVVHWWFPVYNQDYAGYSPGGILLLKLLEAAVAEGVKSIDLGKGDDIYKESFANGGVPLAEGSFMLPSYQALNRRLATGIDRFLRHSPVMAPARQLVRSARSFAER